MPKGEFVREVWAKDAFPLSHFPFSLAFRGKSYFRWLKCNEIQYFMQRLAQFSRFVFSDLGILEFVICLTP